MEKDQEENGLPIKYVILYFGLPTNINFALKNSYKKKGLPHSQKTFNIQRNNLYSLNLLLNFSATDSLYKKYNRRHKLNIVSNYNYYILC